MKIQVSKKNLDKIDECFYQIVPIVAKNGLLSRIKNYTILTIFEMISLK